MIRWAGELEKIIQDEAKEDSKHQNSDTGRNVCTDERSDSLETPSAEFAPTARAFLKRLMN